jgi:hypothetical protein
MSTITLGLADKAQPEAAHVGLNIANCRVSLSVSWSSTDVHRIGKLPHGAIPLEAIWYPGSTFAATGIAKFGTSASAELFFASDSYAESGTTIYRNTVQLGTSKQLSLSDDAMPRFEYITMTATAGVSIGFVGELIVYYRMPGQTF